MLAAITIKISDAGGTRILCRSSVGGCHAEPVRKVCTKRYNKQVPAITSDGRQVSYLLARRGEYLAGQYPSPLIGNGIN